MVKVADAVVLHTDVGTIEAVLAVDAVVTVLDLDAVVLEVDAVVLVLGMGAAVLVPAMGAAVLVPAVDAVVLVPAMEAAVLVLAMDTVVATSTHLVYLSMAIRKVCLLCSYYLASCTDIIQMKINTQRRGQCTQSHWYYHQGP